MTVRAMTAGDWPSVSAIYAGGLATGNAAFATVVPPRDDWDGSHLTDHRFVAESDGEVVGWVALSSVSSRCVDAGVAEVSIYIDGAWRGRGVGSALLTTVVTDSERGGLWTLQAEVFPENTASLRLHERCGFRVVGTRERIGQRHGDWRDIVLLERRRAD